jgi:hypothetical protein
MSVGPIFSSVSNFQANGQQTMAQYFQALSQALQSGNTQGAQQAYNSLIQNLPNQNAATGFNKPVNPVQQRFAEIGNALKSGDLEGANASMQALEQHLQAHNNHMARAQLPDSAPPAPVSPPSDQTPDSQSANDDGSTQTFATGPARFVGLVA